MAETKLKVGNKVKVKVGHRWQPGRIAELTHEGRLARVELDRDSEHKSVYAAADGLRRL